MGGCTQRKTCFIGVLYAADFQKDKSEGGTEYSTVTTIPAVRGGMPPRVEDISIAMGVVTDFGTRESMVSRLPEQPRKEHNGDYAGHTAGELGQQDCPFPPPDLLKLKVERNSQGHNGRFSRKLM
jgi:hypothetical protein